jgi:hypothetical protein
VFAVAALIAVPLPFRSPVTVVDRVMAGVDVGVATVPARPFAETTETDCTVPTDPVAQEGFAPSVVRNFPLFDV